MNYDGEPVSISEDLWERLCEKFDVKDEQDFEDLVHGLLREALDRRRDDD